MHTQVIMITVQIQGDHSYQIAWLTKMTGQQTLQAGYNTTSYQADFTFSLQYYGDNT